MTWSKLQTVYFLGARQHTKKQGTHENDSYFLSALAAAGAAGYFLCCAGAAPDAEQLKQFERLAYFKNGRFTAENDVSVHPEKMTGGSTFLVFLR